MVYILIIVIIFLIFFVFSLKKQLTTLDKRIFILQDFVFGIHKTIRNKGFLNENIVDSLANGVFYKDIMFNKLYEKNEKELILYEFLQVEIPLYKKIM